MSNLELKDPAYLFEVSWEVCNQKQPYIDRPGRVAV